jgi:hypothetical protein
VVVSVEPPPPDEPPVPEGSCRWSQVAAVRPEMAAQVRARFESAAHHVLATLRSDGSPRVSGTEVMFLDGDLAVGSMWMAVKALDLRRDGRFALHSNPGDGSMEGGDAKVSGRAVEILGQRHQQFAVDRAPPSPFHLFRLDIAQVVHSSLHPDGDRMVIRSWTPDNGEVTVER